MGGLNRWIVAVFSVAVFAAGAATASPSRRTIAAPACRAVSPILAIHHVPTLTVERYDAVVRGLTNGRDRLESLSGGGIEGLLFHVAGQGDDGFWIVDVWESPRAVERFSRRVGPLARAAGIAEPMKTYPVHNLLAC
jgi:hypothetical protein